MEVTPGSCPHCGVINRAMETIMGRDGAPKEGDVLICESCAGVSIYNGHGAARIPNEYEKATLVEDPAVALAVLQAELDLL